MKILYLTLTKKWFQRHLEDKTEDYRMITPYWTVRLLEWNDGDKISKQDAVSITEDLKNHRIVHGLRARKFDIVRARNGYSAAAPTFVKPHIDTKVGIGNPIWGAPEKPVFILKLGAMLETRNCKI